jgi:tRNA(Ile)-lysidine synthase
MNLKGLTTFVESVKLFSPDDHILLAVSGGIDSVVLATLFREAGFHFAIAHCNFGLRGPDSEEDAGFVANLAHQLKVPFHSRKFDTEKIAAARGISIQMAARDLRYDWFEKIRYETGCKFIGTAHHLDDQVETFLINLIRGTGIAGLHGIPVKNGSIIRPLMFAFRKDIEEYALQHHIAYRMDHSNDETKYLRNKIRHEVIPLLISINPEFTHGLTDSVRRIREFEQIGNRALADWCLDTTKYDGNDKYIEIEHLVNTSPAEPYVWSLLSPYGFNETQVSNLLGSLENEDKKVFFSATHRLVKARGRLVISLLEPNIRDLTVRINLFARKKTISNPLDLVFKRITDVEKYEIPATGETASLDFNKLHFPLTLRKWRQGDVFYPLGMRKKKKLSDFFIDQKFSLNKKEHTWLLCSGNDIAWIIGHRIDHRYRVTSVTAEILRIDMRDAGYGIRDT